eukprot:gene20655-26236_t
MTRFSFHIHATDGRARTGVIQMQRGDIRTPAFMPVGTAATVKAMKMADVRAAGADIIELGMPFSDPMADGPAIQASGLRALKAGQTLAK